MATSFRFPPMRALALLAAAGAMLTGCTTLQPASSPATVAGPGPAASAPTAAPSAPAAPLPACARRERLRSPLRPAGCGRSPT